MVTWQVVVTWQMGVLVSCAFFDVCKGRVILQRTPCGDVAGGGDVADGGVGVLCIF